MELWFEHLITQSTGWSLAVVGLVAFFESLALVGLLLPGTVMMATLGALIGSGQLALYPAWGVGIFGCLLGDWLSFYLGRTFKGPLHHWSFMKKHHVLLQKTEYALHRHSLFTVLIGRFIGPTRPLIPMVAGMLELPVRQFVLPNLLGCVLWPPLYFMPGILAGVALDVPSGEQNSTFKGLMLAVAIIVWMGLWLGWRGWRKSTAQDWASGWLSAARLKWLAPLGVIAAVVSVVAIQFHPVMPLFRHLLWQV
ncbi:DedA family protein, partial [Enterobacteriaceae bacterium LUAb1]